MDPGLIERVRMRDKAQRGFTLIEMMIVVAVIAALAAIVVPTFFKESRKTKGASEITPMFAELSVREEQYKTDNGVYLASTACPATSSAAGNAASGCLTAGSPWTNLRVNPPQTMLYCSYVVVIGDATGTNNPDGFTFTSPAFNWYYIEATCDMDNDTTRDAKYFVSSVDSAIQKRDEGY